MAYVGVGVFHKASQTFIYRAGSHPRAHNFDHLKHTLNNPGLQSQTSSKQHHPPWFKTLHIP